MSKSITIEKKPDLQPSEDYHLLRKEGIAHLEDLGSRLWTDFNIHDPGITILEMLCYAISDLGYRTSYDIRDLLNLQEGDGYFHTAREILTINPTTINDYRKLLVDVVGVRNAWLNPTQENEIPFYVDLINGRLSYLPGPKNFDRDGVFSSPADKDRGRVFLNGLYSVLLEFEEDEEFGDLNDPVLKRSITVEGEEQEIEFVFPAWAELFKYEKEERVREFLNLGVITKIEVDQANIEPDGENKAYRLPVDLTFEVEELLPAEAPETPCHTDLPADLIGDAVEADLYPKAQEPPVIKQRTFRIPILVRYPGRASDYEASTISFLEDNVDGRLLEFFRQRMAFTIDIVDRVMCALMDHRNLCEDFVEIRSLQTEEIGVCADIEVAPDANVNRVMADILYQLEQFISPPINFYSLKELLDEGKRAEDIFNGPALQHGFLKNEELDKAILAEEIHVSDLYNIIMDVEGVLAVRDLQVANYIEGVPQTDGEEWILPLTNDQLHVAKLSLEKSKILFFKDVLPYRADEDEVLEYLAEIEARERRGRLMETTLDLEVPEGTDLEPGVYSTMQNDFPLAYGLGKAGIPGTPDDFRKAQARQLKGFLLFFDQLLANYLAQLAHARELFSMDPAAAEHSYYSQPVEDLKDIENLYKRWTNADGFDLVQEQLDDLAEDAEEYAERRNRFLDHLMARFAESFSEYALIMFALRKDKAPEELIQDKLNFLNDYPAISGDRGKGYNYRPKVDCKYCNPHQLWNTNNVSGFKKRVARLLGMEGYQRRNLTGHCFVLVEMEYTTRDTVWVWELRDIDNKSEVLLRSIEYETEEAAEFMISYAIAMVEEGRLKNLDPDRHEMKCCNRFGVDDLSEADPVTDEMRFVLLNACQDVIACSPVDAFATETEREEARQKVYDYVMGYCNIEGFHLVEHLLLRPRFADDEGGYRVDNLLPICADGEMGQSFQSELRSRLFYEVYLDGIGEWRFRVRDPLGKVILRSEGYQQISGMQAGIESMLANVLNPNRYERKPSIDGKYYFNLRAANNHVVATSVMFDTPQDREIVIQSLLALDPDADRLDAGPLKSVCLEDSDPYSFRVSIVLPAWAGRFRDVNFRQLVEKTLRKEAPAHIYLRICWIDRTQMGDFECALLNWTLAMGNCNNHPKDVSPALNELIEQLYHLRNVYPVATLHDCDADSGGSGQVVLNYTSLGTL